MIDCSTVLLLLDIYQYLLVCTWNSERAGTALIGRGRDRSADCVAAAGDERGSDGSGWLI